MNKLLKLSRSMLRPAVWRIWQLQERMSGLHVGLGSHIIRPRSVTSPECIHIGRETRIHAHAQIMAFKHFASTDYKPQIRIGNRVHIGSHVLLVAIDSLVIEDECVLSEHVYISDHGHGLNPADGPIGLRGLESRGPVRIGKGSFIGLRSIVLDGVELGEHCVVGANSVVTHSFPAYSMVAGSPARLIKTYSHATRQWVKASGSAASRLMTPPAPPATPL